MIDVEAFYRKYAPMVLRRCRAMLRDEDRALDAMQEVFIRVLRRKDDLHAGAPSSLLYRIATNVCLNVIRSDKRKPLNAKEELLEQIAGLDDPEEKVIHSHLLEKIFGGEKESTKLIATLHYVDGFTLEQTAEQVGLSVSGVRKRLRGLRSRGLACLEA